MLETRWNKQAACDHGLALIPACMRACEKEREREREKGGGRALTEIGAGPLDACNTEFALITRAARHPLPAAASSSAFRQRVRREPGSFPLPGRRVQRTCRASVVIERQSFFPLLLFHNIAVRTWASFIVPPSMGAPHSWDRTRYRVIAAQRRRVVCPRVDDDLLVASVRRNPEEETHAPRENSRTPAARSLPTASGSSTYLAESSSGTRRRRPGTTSHPAPSVAVALSSGGWSKGLEYIRRMPRWTPRMTAIERPRWPSSGERSRLVDRALDVEEKSDRSPSNLDINIDCYIALRATASFNRVAFGKFVRGLFIIVGKRNRSLA